MLRVIYGSVTKKTPRVTLQSYEDVVKADLDCAAQFLSPCNRVNINFLESSKKYYQINSTLSKASAQRENLEIRFTFPCERAS